MATFTFKSPDGKSYRINGPEGATADQAFQMLQKQIGAGTAQAQEAPAPATQAAQPAAAPVAAPASSFDPTQYGEDFKAARAAIDQLPEHERKAAVEAYAKDYVTRERKDGGIGQSINDHVRMFSRNVPFVGEFLDEANAGTAALLGGDYELAKAAEHERRRQLDAEERAGIETPLGKVDTGDLAKGAGLVAGAVAAPAATVARGAGYLPTMSNSAVNTALYAGADKAGQTDGGIAERVTAGLGEVPKAAATGAVAGAVGKKILDKALTPKPVYAPGRSVDDLRKTADAAYKAAEKEGVIYTRAVPGRVQQGIVDDLTEFGYHPGLHPKISTLVSEAERLAGQNVTLKGMDTFRKMAVNVAKSNDPAERQLAGKIISRIDDAIENPKAFDVMTGQGDKASKALMEARKTWKTMRKAEAVEGAIAKAESRASGSGSGGNINNATRQELKKLAEGKRTGRMFTPAERTEMLAINKGTTKGNLARAVGKLSPTGNGLMQNIHLFGGIATGGGTLPLAGIGYVAKKLADRGTVKSADQLLQKISGGGQIGQKFATWQKIVGSAGATDATKKVALKALATAIADDEGSDPDEVAAALAELQ